MKKLLVLATAALLLTACNKKQEPTTNANEPVAANVTASIGTTATRATGSLGRCR